MKRLLNEISRRVSHADTRPTATGLPGVLIIQGEVPDHQLAAIYEPVVGLLVQGSKTLSIGEQVVHFKAPSYFVIPTEMPVTGKVGQGPKGPYQSVGLSLNPDTLLDMLKTLPDDHFEERPPTEFSSCPATPEFLEAWLRMLRLLETPEHIPALAPLYEREILYRVLTGPEGWRLRRICRIQGKVPKISRVIRGIRKDYAKPLDIERSAEESGMGVTTFHRQFKQLTGLSPVQFQKQLRLLEARKLMVFGGFSVAEAAFKVGYESPSQFNREYGRWFGASPARDASSIRRIEQARLESKIPDLR